MIDDKEILDDFKKILKYLGVKKKIYLHLALGTREGLYREDMGIIFLGVKDGYDRKLLVHECIHILGKQHFTDGFDSVLRFDTYSAKLELEIFGE